MLVLASANAQGRKKTKTAQAKSAASASPQVVFDKEIKPFMLRFCACHGPKDPPGGVSLTNVSKVSAITSQFESWQHVSEVMQGHVMPPKDSPQPDAKLRERVATWISTTLNDAACEVKQPGRVTMRRLNREEYNNTVRDLFGVSIRPADEFPTDDVGYGFDNIGDVLSMSPLLMEKYVRAADKVAKAVIVSEVGKGVTRRIEAEKLPEAPATVLLPNGRMLNSNTEIGETMTFTRAGDYTLRARAGAQQAGPDYAKMAFRVDGKTVGEEAEIKSNVDKPENAEVRIRIEPGKHRIGVAFTNDFFDPMARGNRKDRNLFVDYIEVVEPPVAQGDLPEIHRRIIPISPEPDKRDATAKLILGKLAKKAFRRPVTAQEVERLCRYVKMAEKEGDTFERGIQVAIQAMLCSPNFLFRVESDPPGAKGDRNVNDWELATRLSYFLWSSMPDDTLFALAEKGQLRKPEVIKQQVARMLKDPKSKALADNFAVQWLTLKNLAYLQPDPKRFPAFNDKLRSAMQMETERFFQAVAQEDRSILDFIDGKFTYVNEPLAKLYGIEGVQGEEFRKVVLDGKERAGVLTQASILTVTSNPTRTSPVKRGKWILEQMLGTPPPPPIPGVVPLEDSKQLTGTLRQKMEQHRKDPLCASCHARMDPLGFGFENFDAIGAWRTTDEGQMIDSSGELPGGLKFNGPAELRKILLLRKDQFTRNFIEKMLTYGLGRGLERFDRCNVEEMAKDVSNEKYRFSSVIMQVVMSDPFLKRRVTEPAKSAAR